ncbi:DctP family TRAP transporter solute-binding subunit [Bacillus sp. H-16]|uniref:DctP family TRAP transporter solute-binding subunit n=1 Tax=Alteribacter salitolerans TaxID=2912333 RepID=UPI001962F6AA|nr:DctP family TRAP transporter solute-binding subunit [Alteribacter salitolerans]MBM7095176.1 DctP family TRAP transporter solute-binding subunit [Alteribacter salitolerans]
MKKKTKILSAVLLTGTVLVGCGNSESTENQSAAGSEGNGQAVTLSFAYELPSDHPWGHGAERFKEIVEEETDGQITVELYGGGQLGGTGREIQEGAQVGTIDIGISSTPMAQLNPTLDIFSLPYIFQSREHAWEVLDGEIGQQVGDKLEESNLKHLAYWEDGFRQVTNDRTPITSPEDFQGLRIRVPESNVRMETFNALGASPLPMAWSEVFTALQQGTIDGQENPLSVIHSASFYDVQEYLTITNHVYSPATLFMSEEKWEQLDEEHQDIILEAAAAGRDVNREMNQEQDEALVKELEENGMEVTEITDMQAFQERTQPVWSIVTDELGGEAEEIINSILETQ